MNQSRPILSQSRGQFTYYPEFNNGNLLLVYLNTNIYKFSFVLYSAF